MEHLSNIEEPINKADIENSYREENSRLYRIIGFKDETINGLLTAFSAVRGIVDRKDRDLLDTVSELNIANGKCERLLEENAKLKALLRNNNIDF